MSDKRGDFKEHELAMTYWTKTAGAVGFLLMALSCGSNDETKASDTAAGAGAGGGTGSGGTGSGGTGSGGETGSSADEADLCGASENYCNGVCLKEVGDESQGCRLLYKSGSSVSSLTIDSEALYYTDGKAITRLELATMSPSTLVSGLFAISNLTLAADTFYFFDDTAGIETSTGTLKQVPRTGGSPSVIAQRLDSPGMLSIAEGKAYFLNSPWGSGKTLLLSAPLTGGSAQAVGTIETKSYLIDGTALYFVSSATDTERKLQATTLTDPTNLATLTSNVYQNRIISDSDALYWAIDTMRSSGTEHAYYRIPKAGGTPSKLVEGKSGWTIRHVQGGTVYVLEVEPLEIDGGDDRYSRIVSMPIGGSDPRVLANVERGRTGSIVTDATHVYIAARGGILQLEK